MPRRRVCLTLDAMANEICNEHSEDHAERSNELKETQASYEAMMLNTRSIQRKRRVSGIAKR